MSEMTRRLLFECTKMLSRFVMVIPPLPARAPGYDLPLLRGPLCTAYAPLTQPRTSPLPTVPVYLGNARMEDWLGHFQRPLEFHPNPECGGRFELTYRGEVVYRDHGDWTTRRAAWKAAKSHVKRWMAGYILKPPPEPACPSPQ